MGERQVLRNPALMKRVPFLAGFLVVLGFLEGDYTGGALILWIGAAFAVVFAVRPSVTIAPEGVIVSNMLARRYLWDEIADVESRYRYYGPALRLNLTDGSHKYAWAVASGKVGWGAGWIERSIAQVRERWLRERSSRSRSPGSHDA